MRPSLIAAPLFAMSMLFAQPALAATDGVRGATSSGSFDISAEITGADGVAQISGLNDFVFGPIARGVERSVRDEVCLFHTSPTVRLQVSQAGSPSFALVGPNGARLPYLVTLNRFGGSAAFPNDVQRGPVDLSGVVGNRTDPQCSTGGQAIDVLILLVENTQTLGLYSATMNIIVSVE